MTSLKTKRTDLFVEENEIVIKVINGIVGSDVASADQNYMYVICKTCLHSTVM